jgi:predicted ATPase
MTAQQQRDATLDAIVAGLIEVAERAPVLMAWEDLHWADPTTLETLGVLIEQAPHPSRPATPDHMPTTDFAARFRAAPAWLRYRAA